MADSLKASEQGLLLVDQERCKKGWNKDAQSWLDEANVSRSTLKGFGGQG